MALYLTIQQFRSSRPRRLDPACSQILQNAAEWSQSHGSSPQKGVRKSRLLASTHVEEFPGRDASLLCGKSGACFLDYERNGGEKGAGHFRRLACHGTTTASLSNGGRDIRPSRSETSISETNALLTLCEGPRPRPPRRDYY